MTKDEIIKALRDMARYPTVTLPRDSEALKVAADLLAQPEQCQCPNCRVTLHASDCAVHNAPAYPVGECDCGAQPYPENFIDALTYDVARRDSESAQQEPDAYVQKVIEALYENSDPVSVEAAELLERMAQRKLLTDERLELIGHADLAINNIYIFNGYGEEVPEGRTPIYAGYKAAHGIVKE